MNSFQYGMKLFQIRMNSFLIEMNSLYDRYSHTGRSKHSQSQNSVSQSKMKRFRKIHSFGVTFSKYFEKIESLGRGHP